jgi:hypothetical protein
MTAPPSKTCQRCNAAFGCGADVGHCWCSEQSFRMPLPKPGVSEFSDCLCPACLRAVAAERGLSRDAPEQIFKY